MSPASFNRRRRWEQYSLSTGLASNSIWDEAELLTDDGRFDEAIPLLLEVTGDGAEHADPCKFLGFTNRKTGQLDATL